MKYGRMNVIIVFKSIGVLLLYSLSLTMYVSGSRATRVETLPLYVLHKLFITATIPAQISVLIDYAPNRHIMLLLTLYEAVVFQWTGSASLGTAVSER